MIQYYKKYIFNTTPSCKFSTYTFTEKSVQYRKLSLIHYWRMWLFRVLFIPFANSTMCANWLFRSNLPHWFSHMFVHRITTWMGFSAESFFFPLMYYRYIKLYNPVTFCCQSVVMAWRTVRTSPTLKTNLRKFLALRKIVKGFIHEILLGKLDNVLKFINKNISFI